MVAAIEFAVRTVAGGNQHGFVSGDGQSNFIQVGSGDSVSLNLSQSSIVAYERQGGDLVIKLIDGRSIVLLDTRGFLAEGLGSNVFLVKDGVLYTPKEQYVLAGISRATSVYPV